METVDTLIVGQGLAGTCLAWALWERGEKFLLVDRERGPASSRVAAGMINPVTGKSWSASWRLGEFLPEARAFYRQVEARLEAELFFDLKVVRLVAEAERPKAAERMRACPVPHREVAMPEPWRIGNGWEIDGGGRLDAPGFVAASRRFFAERARYRRAEATGAGVAGVAAARTVFCEGAVGLLAGVARALPSRCAKGEILTVEIPGLNERRAVVGGGGWLVPVGGDRYKAGASYVWEPLDAEPTPEGRAWVENVVRRLVDLPFRVVEHVAGIRPIVRRSEPVIGPMPGSRDRIVFNGLGSKGALYAPGAARRLADWLVDGSAIEPDLSPDFLR